MSIKEIKETGLEGDARLRLITRSELVKHQHHQGAAAQLYLRSELEASVARLAEIDELEPTEASKVMAELRNDGAVQARAAGLVRAEARMRAR